MTLPIDATQQRQEFLNRGSAILGGFPWQIVIQIFQALIGILGGNCPAPTPTPPKASDKLRQAKQFLGGRPLHRHIRRAAYQQFPEVSTDPNIPDAATAMQGMLDIAYSNQSDTDVDSWAAMDWRHP